MSRPFDDPTEVRFKSFQAAYVSMFQGFNERGAEELPSPNMGDPLDCDFVSMNGELFGSPHLSTRLPLSLSDGGLFVSMNVGIF